MGLMDMLGGALGGGGKNGSMLDMVMGMIQQHPGGLGGMLEQLKAAGLSKQVDSWVGTGANMPVSGDQIKAALGSAKLNEIAKNTGISHDEAADGLAKHLPDIINHLSPNGNVPDGDITSQAMAMLRTKFSGG